MLENILPFFIIVSIFIPVTILEIYGYKFINRQNKAVIFTLLALLIVFAGFRWSTGFGTDYEVYSMVYENPVDLFNFIDGYSDFTAYVTKIDIGYVFISSFFANYISDNPNVFFTVLSIITLTLFYKSFKRNGITDYIYLILLIFVARLYFQYPFTLMRQALILSVLWYYIPLVHKRKFWSFLLLCLLCTTIHFSAIFFIITYWLPKAKFSNKQIIITMGVLFLLSITKITDKIILSSLDVMLEMVGLSSRLSGYLVSETYSKGINLFNFLEIAPFVYWALKYRKKLFEDKNGKLFFNMLMFYTTFLILTMNMMALTRLSSYFIYSYFFIISFAFSKFKLESNKRAIGLLIISYFLMYIIRYIMFNFSTNHYEPFFLNL